MVAIEVRDWEVAGAFAAFFVVVPGRLFFTMLESGDMAALAFNRPVTEAAFDLAAAGDSACCPSFAGFFFFLMRVFWGNAKTESSLDGDFGCEAELRIV